MQHGAAPGCNADLPTHKKSHIPLVAAPCTLTDVAAVPPRGVELLRYLSGYSANSSELSADVSADSLNPEQLAAMLRDLDRSELEQLLLTLLSKAESASE